jgi:hypothetical protein
MTLAYILPAAITLITRIPMGKFLTPSSSQRWKGYSSAAARS